MLPKWWIEQVNYLLKGTGEVLIPIRSFNEALIWEVLEVLVIIQAGVVGLFLINPIIGSFGYIAGILATFVIMAKFMMTMKHPSINCWKGPEDPKIVPWHSE